MTLQEVTEKLENSDKVIIIDGDKQIFVGWLAMLIIHNENYERIKSAEVKRIRAVPELRHKKWKEMNLMSPLEPDRTPDFAFSDLQMNLYYTIYIQQERRQAG